MIATTPVNAPEIDVDAEIRDVCADVYLCVFLFSYPYPENTKWEGEGEEEGEGEGGMEGTCRFYLCVYLFQLILFLLKNGGRGTH